MRMVRNDKGITLIALVVTMVILIILAVVSINLVLDENGIIAKAMLAQKMQQQAEEKDKIELVKATVIIDNRGKLVADKYVQELINQGVTTEDNVKNNENGSMQIITSTGRILLLQINEEGNVTGMTDNGEADALTVNIKNVQLTAKTHTIKIDIEVERGEGATYTYSYKLENGEYVQAYSGEETSYTIEKLEAGTAYWVKVVATNDYGTVSTEILEETKAIVSGQESVADVQKIAEYSDQFATIEAEVYIDSLTSSTGESFAKVFVQAVVDGGITTKDNISVNSNGNYEIMTPERYVFEVVEASSSNVEVNYIGIAEK